MPRIKEVKEIPLNDLYIEKAQVRTREVGKEIDELADSIRKVGLLEPIVVCESDDNKKGQYEIITGQRRFLAHQEIGAKTILAAILDEKVDEVTAKYLSLTENLVRRDLNRKDLIDVCTMLYKRYGSVAAVCEETGLSRSKVDQYVKYDRLVGELRTLVDEGTVDLPTALRAQDAAAVTGSIKVEEAVKLAKEMAPMSGAQQKSIVTKRKEAPTAQVDQIIEDAKSGERITQIVVTLGGAVHESLRHFARAENTSQDNAAADLIEEGLSQKGYLSSSDTD